MARRPSIAVVGIGAFTLAWGVSAHAADFYVDPKTGAPGNDGSAGSPWRTLEEVVGAGRLGTTVKAGDTLHLRSGYHGTLDIRSGQYVPALTIAAESGETAQLGSVRIDNASGIVLRGVAISPSYAATYQTVTMVDIGGGASAIAIENCSLTSEADVSAWGADEWINRASSGFQVSGDDVTVKGNTLENVRFGISVDGQRALVDHNTVDGFSADGLRGLGDDDVFQYNVVKNVYVSDADGDTNHDDGFQSWSVGPGGVGTGEVRGVVLRGNLILNYEDPNQPLKNSLQGIGCFDGTFVDWIIENNVVITDHWHGITLLGARNSRIVNNTVLDVNDTDPGPPWIMIDAHKDGTPPTGCVVRNNLATDFSNASTVTEDHNTVITDPLGLFVNPAAHDLHLLPNAPVIDQGSPDLAPVIDADGIPRPQGAAVDEGAFEWHEPGVTPVDGGSGTGGAMSSGGAPSAGGASGQDASAGSGGTTAAGGASGSGGATSGTGAGPAVGAGGGSAWSADAGADASTLSASSKDAGGCGCHTTKSRGAAARDAAWLVALVHAIARRRRRSRLDR